MHLSAMRNFGKIELYLARYSHSLWKILNQQFKKTSGSYSYEKCILCLYAFTVDAISWYGWWGPMWLTHMAEQLKSGSDKHMHLAQRTTVILQRCVDSCRRSSLKCERLYESKKQLICILLCSWTPYSDVEEIFPTVPIMSALWLSTF